MAFYVNYLRLKIRLGWKLRLRSSHDCLKNEIFLRENLNLMSNKMIIKFFIFFKLFF